jgi:hypothetical protein
MFDPLLWLIDLVVNRPLCTVCLWRDDQVDNDRRRRRS